MDDPLRAGANRSSCGEPQPKRQKYLNYFRIARLRLLYVADSDGDRLRRASERDTGTDESRARGYWQTERQTESRGPGTAATLKVETLTSQQPGPSGS